MNNHVMELRQLHDVETRAAADGRPETEPNLSSSTQPYQFSLFSGAGNTTGLTYHRPITNASETDIISTYHRPVASTSSNTGLNYHHLINSSGTTIASTYHNPITNTNSTLSNYHHPTTNTSSAISNYHHPTTNTSSTLSSHHHPTTNTNSTLSNYHHPTTNTNSTVSSYHHPITISSYHQISPFISGNLTTNPAHHTHHHQPNVIIASNSASAPQLSSVHTSNFTLTQPFHQNTISAPTHSSSATQSVHNHSPFTSYSLVDLQDFTHSEHVHDSAKESKEPHMNLLYKGDEEDEDSPEASVSFQMPVTPHLDRYSHSGQVPSCDARRPSSLKHVTAEDINVTASPILRGSEKKPPPNLIDNQDPDILTPIKTLDFDIDDDDDDDDSDENPPEIPQNSGVERMRLSLKSVTSTPDPKSLEKIRKKFQSKSREPEESPILSEGDAMKTGSVERTDRLSGSFVSDIDDMERVRGHLHNMLKLSDHALNPGSNTNSTQTMRENLLHDGGQGYNGGQGHNGSDQKRSAVDLFMGSNYMSSLLSEPQAGRYQADPTLVAENNVLKESLEKERYRRKHCEDHIQQLNAKMLDMQQELAVAVATDHRKDTMIEQLDRQLAKVVDGWKRREADKESYITRLKNEKNRADADLHQQQQMLRKLELDLTATIEDLKTERDMANSCVLQLRQQVSTLSEELSNTTGLVTSERERADILQSEWNKAREGQDTADTEIQRLVAQLQMEKEEHEDKERDLKERMELLEQEREADLGDEKMKTDMERQRADELKAELTRSETECKTLEMEVQCKKTETESLKVSMALLEAKHENGLRSLEADLRGEMEQETANKIRELHKKSELSEKKTHESHRTQLRDITQQHATEIQHITEQLNIKDDALRRIQVEYDEKLMESQTEIQNLKSQKDRLQSQRSEALTKMQTLMQSQWNEALSLLGSPHKPLSRSSAPNLPHQNPTESESPHDNSLSSNASFAKSQPSQTFHSNETSPTNSTSAPHNNQSESVNKTVPSHERNFASGDPNQSKTTDLPNERDFVSHDHNQQTSTNVHNFASHNINYNRHDFDSMDNFSPLSIMKRVDEQSMEFTTSQSDHHERGFSINHNLNPQDRGYQLYQSLSLPKTSSNIRSPKNHSRNLQRREENGDLQSQNTRNTDARSNQETGALKPIEAKSVHFSENDLFHSAEISLINDRSDRSLSNPSNLTYHNENLFKHPTNPDFVHSTITHPHITTTTKQSPETQFSLNQTTGHPEIPVAMAMRLPQQSDWLPGNRTDIDVTNQDDDDGLYSPMPQFSDDESTVAEREAEGREDIFDLRPRLLQFSPPVKQKKAASPRSMGDNSMVDGSDRPNESFYGDVSQSANDQSTRQSELTHYIQMLLHKSPGSTTDDRSPVRDTDCTPPHHSTTTHHPTTTYHPTTTHHIQDPQVNQQGPYQKGSPRSLNLRHSSINSSPRTTPDTDRPKPKPESASADKLSEVSRLLALYSTQTDHPGAREPVSSDAQQILAMIKDIHESRQSSNKPQSSPKTKPNPRGQLVQQNRKVKKVVPARPATAHRDTSITRSEHDDRKTTRTTATTNNAKTTRRTTPAAAKPVLPKGSSAWK